MEELIENSLTERLEEDLNAEDPRENFNATIRYLDTVSDSLKRKKQRIEEDDYKIKSNLDIDSEEIAEDLIAERHWIGNTLSYIYDTIKEDVEKDREIIDKKRNGNNYRIKMKDIDSLTNGIEKVKDNGIDFRKTIEEEIAIIKDIIGEKIYEKAKNYPTSNSIQNKLNNRLDYNLSKSELDTRLDNADDIYEVKVSGNIHYSILEDKPNQSST